ncbi:MAG: hypothetical protein RIS35_335 [Pseudomonadota bacterium]|jgi:hypothetical protein
MKHAMQASSIRCPRPAERAPDSPIWRSTPRRSKVATAIALAFVAVGPAMAAGPTTESVPEAVASSDPTVRWVGRFVDDTSVWREIRLKSDLAPNRFRFRDWDGVRALEVRSSASMSLMARPLDVDLDSTPVLCWRWRVDGTIAAADMRSRAGDDYAARVYVSFRLPPESIGIGLKAKLAVARALWGPELPDAAINYVWDNRNPKGTEQPNAYTDRTRMVVLRSGDAEAGRWVPERRDVAADVARLFGPRAQAVQLALAADTDNTGASVRSGFADFHFVPRNRPCGNP